MFAPKKMPRHQISFKVDYTSDQVPRFWRKALSSAYQHIVRPVLRNSSDYYSPNMTFWKSYTRNVDRNLPYSGITKSTLFLTRNDTIAIRIAAPSETWVWNDIKLPTFIRSLPVGSRHMPVVFKMYWTKGKGNLQIKSNSWEIRQHYMEGPLKISIAEELPSLNMWNK